MKTACRKLLPTAIALSLALRALPAARAINPNDLQFLTTLEQAEAQYFIDQAQPPYYLMPNLWTTSGPDVRCTDEGTGLELAALCIADSHGWIAHATALSRAQTIVQEMAAIQQQNLTNYPGCNGFFFHYMNADGTRYNTSNMGTDDGARFLNGALTARQYFNDPTVTQYVNQIYQNMNWQGWVGTKNQVFESWTPESGFGNSQWGRYSEGPLQVYLLGMGSPNPNYALTAANWASWTRGAVNTYGTNPTYTWIGNSPALFVQQFPQAFLDLYGLTDNSSSGGGISYWNNSVQATLAQWQWSQDISQGAINGEGPFPLWGVNLWGLTATNTQNDGYQTWGGPQPCSPPLPDGTLTPAAAGGSLPFTPSESLQTLEYLYNTYPQTWLTDPVTGHAYGFADAFNPEATPIWYDNQFSTNGAGQTLIMAENYVTGLVWKYFMSAPEIVNALNLAQLTAGTSVDVTPGSGWATSAFTSETGAFTVTFSAILSAAPTDSMVGLSKGAQTSINKYAALVRFAASGDIVADNGGTFEAQTTIPYAAGVTYQFELVVNVPSRTYTIYVTPAGGSQQTVGTNYAFALGDASLDHWGAMMEPAGSGTMTVNDFSP